MTLQSKKIRNRFIDEAHQWLKARRVASKPCYGQETGKDLDVGMLGGLTTRIRVNLGGRGTIRMREYLEGADLVMTRAPGHPWLFLMDEKTMARVCTALSEAGHCPQDFFRG